MADTWRARILTLAAWAVAGWSATYWALQWAGDRPALPPASSAAPPPAITAVDPAARFTLVGVVADRTRSGVALLSIEGQPARPYSVGARIEERYRLHSVTARSATLTGPESGTRFTVPLATPGTLPARPVAALPGGPGLPARPAAATASAPPAGAGTAAPSIPMPRFGPQPAASMARRTS
jgi:general secretion pathway protein C